MPGRGFMPFYLNLEGFRVAVLGGGSVGVRRARYFSQAGALVTVYSLELNGASREELEAEGVRFVEADLGDKEVASRVLEENDLVVIALDDPELARRLAEEAIRRGKLVNNAVDATGGNVIVPFQGLAWGGRLGLAVTSFGEMGITARRVLEKLLQTVEEERALRSLHELLSSIKQAAKLCIGEPKRRVALYLYLSDHPHINELITRRAWDTHSLAKVMEEVLEEEELECILHEIPSVEKREMEKHVP